MVEGGVYIARSKNIMTPPIRKSPPGGLGQLGVAGMVYEVGGKRTYPRSRRRPQSLFKVSSCVLFFGEFVDGLWVSESHIVGILKVVRWLKVGGIQGCKEVLEGDIATAG